MADALLGSVPIAMIYVFFLDYYVSGLTAGATKGQSCVPQMVRRLRPLKSLVLRRSNRRWTSAGLY
jgi:hypothetical protein